MSIITQTVHVCRIILPYAFGFFLLSRQKMKGSGYLSVPQEMSGATILVSSPCSDIWKEVAETKYVGFPLVYAGDGLGRIRKALGGSLTFIHASNLSEIIDLQENRINSTGYCHLF